MWLTVGAVYFFFLAISSTYAAVGDKCKTPNQDDGSCISIYDCEPLLGAITSKDKDQLRFIRESQCGGNERGPLVCCGTDTNFRFNFGFDSRPTQATRRPTGSGRPNVASNVKCGLQVGERILGGTNTSFEEFPWMALLQYQKGNGAIRSACGGTIISSRYILTAAHCIVGQIQTKLGRLVNVRLGEHDTSSNPDCRRRSGFNLCNDPYVDIGVDDTFVHPGYSDTNNNRYDDIALVRLARDITFTDYVRPICLPSIGEDSGVGDVLTVAGWGRTEVSSSSAVKLKLDLPIADKSVCTRTFRSAGVNLGNKQICAGGERGKDSCTGDSGGPLMKVEEVGGASQWTIEGVVSFGARCGTEGWPGIYTRVAAYIDWINQQIS